MKFTQFAQGNPIILAGTIVAIIFLFLFIMGSASG